MAPPKSSDTEASNAHRMSATIPAEGPYVFPNVELIWNMASRANGHDRQQDDRDDRAERQP